MADMNLDSTSSIDISQKVIPSPLLLLEPRQRDMDAMRQQASYMGQHLALRLGVDGQLTGLFVPSLMHTTESCWVFALKIICKKWTVVFKV